MIKLFANRNCNYIDKTMVTTVLSISLSILLFLVGSPNFVSILDRFSCLLCQASFVQKPHLIRHQSTLHQAKPSITLDIIGVLEGEKYLEIIQDEISKR